ncbi:MAG: class I SAM-dependent methyltransferase [Pseudomonadota bacterium]
MNKTATRERWTAAQAAERDYWRSVDVRELLRICAEKPEFLSLVGEDEAERLFAGKDVLEIGCGPLGLSLVSFAPPTRALRRLVKAEPLPRLALGETRLGQQGWAAPFLAWVEALAAEGEYVEAPGEELGFESVFDTVLTYNVLDHVRDPRAVLRCAHRALRPAGRLVVGVDCLSALGRLRFETITRLRYKGTVLVEAHPHTFQARDVERMIVQAGFRMTARLGVPGFLRRLAGRHFRPAFLAVKPD